MSFSKKIVGSVAIATLLWAGATAYVSSNTKAYLEKYIETSNSLNQTNGMKLSLLSFEKGFFSSTAKLSMALNDPRVAEVLKLPLTTEYKIENGPIFFQNGLGFGLSRISSSINFNNFFLHNAELKKSIADDIVFDSTTLVDFSHRIIYKGATNPIVGNIEGTKITIAPFKMSGTLDANTLLGGFTLTNKALKATTQDGRKILLENLELSGDIQKIFKNGFYLGTFNLNVGSVSVKVEKELFPMVVDNASMKLQVSMNENQDNSLTMDVSMDLDKGDTQLPPKIDFAKHLHFEYALEHTKLEAWLSFQDSIKKIQHKQEAILKTIQNTTDNELVMDGLQELIALQESLQNEAVRCISDALIQDKSIFKIATKITDKSALETTANLALTYVGKKKLPTTMAQFTAQFKQEFLDWIKFDTKVKVQKSLIHSLPPELQQQLNMLLMMGMVKEQKHAYTFDANYTPKKLMVNGVDKSDMIRMLERNQ